MPRNFKEGTLLRAQFGEPRTLFALRIGDKDDSQVQSILYRILLPERHDEEPQIEILMDYAGWLTDFWRHESKTFFLGDVDGELYVVDADNFRGYQPQQRGVTQIFGRTLNEVYATAISGMILRWNGEDWASIGPVNSMALLAIGDMPDGRLVAVGEGGTIFVQDGDSWQRLDVPTNVRLTGVGRMQGATYIGGERGTCYRMDDPLNLEAIAGPDFGTYGFVDYSGNGYSASQANGVMVLDGSELVPFAQPLQPYGIAARDDLMAVYGDDRLAWFDGKTWRPINLDAA